jgi:hypothetical protein
VRLLNGYCPSLLVFVEVPQFVFENASRSPTSVLRKILVEAELWRVTSFLERD